VNLKDLTDTPLKLIHDAFLDAFSDYVVPLQLSIAQLESMLARRGYNPSLSVGVFDDETLVAFTLNATGRHCGLNTIYDTGTGVRPSHRGRNLTRAMLAWTIERLPPSMEQYLLEVISTNVKAFTIYRNAGFEIVREFQCWQLTRGLDASEGVGGNSQPTTHNPEPDGRRVEIRETDDLDWDRVAVFRDAVPSWQNSEASIRRSIDSKVMLEAVIDGQIVGFGVIYPASGDLPQLAVHPRWRRLGIGRALLQRVASLSEAPVLRIINVDDSVLATRQFLQQSGAERTVRQFEMSKLIETEHLI
jgi:ribosomal protein S18 acetylase RimI-like enzyme